MNFLCHILGPDSSESIMAGGKMSMFLITNQNKGKKFNFP